MLVIRGHSAIATAFEDMLPAGTPVHWLERGRPVPIGTTRLLVTSGWIAGEEIGRQTDEGLELAWQANFMQPVFDCEAALEHPQARVVVIGSESAFSGSHDLAYASAKAALSRYVESRPLHSPEQQLICIAPSIVGDAGMTLRRDDQDALRLRAAAHPKRRFVTALEVASLAYFLLYLDRGYISGVTIRMHGGGPAWHARGVPAALSASQ